MPPLTTTSNPKADTAKIGKIVVSSTFTYNPLRPQITIAIDHVNRTNNETQPSVKISIPVGSKLKLQNNSKLYNTSKGD